MRPINTHPDTQYSEKMRPRSFARAGFTIVELLIVIVVIGILAAITIVAYNGVQQKAIVASLVSDLSGSATKLKLYQVDNMAYPTLVNDCPTPAATNMCLKASAGNTYTSYVPVNTTKPQTFNLTVTNTNGTSYSITDNMAPTFVSGPTGAVAVPGTPVVTATQASSSQINLTWPAVTNATSYTLQRATNNTWTANLVTQSVTGTSLSVTGLSASTTYYFQLQAVNGSTPGNWSTTASATTAAVYIPPPPPAAGGAPVYAGSSSVTGGSHAGGTNVVNYATSCPSGSSPVNGTYYVYMADTGSTYQYPFGHVDVLYNYGPTNPIYSQYSGATYQCQNANGTSGYSSASGTVSVPVYM